MNLNEKALEAAYSAGFANSSEGYNAEYPFDGDFESDAKWLSRRAEHVARILPPTALVPADVSALVERLRADDLIYNRGPHYEPMRISPSELRLEAASLIQSQAAALAAKNEELARLDADLVRTSSLYIDAISERDAARTQLAEAKKALEPFAKAVLPDPTAISGWRFGTKPTLAHYLDARRVYTGGKDA